VLFVPLVYRERRRWKADALAFTLAQLVNNLWGRVGFEDYKKTAGVVSSNYLGMHTWRLEFKYGDAATLARSGRRFLKGRLPMKAVFCRALFRVLGHRACCEIPEWTAHVGQKWAPYDEAPLNLYNLLWRVQTRVRQYL
jgi:hypothetical protein